MSEPPPNGDVEWIRAARDEAEAIPPLPEGGDLLEPESVPDSIPGYRNIRKLHQGSQGVVFHAIQESTRRNVAIKVLREGPYAGPEDQARFEREIRILGQIDHPNIVSIHEAGVAAGGHYWFVMDYIRGQPLDHYMASGKRSIADTLELFARIAEGVNAAHLKGIIHRDLKPGNIRINSDGEPFILDFGLAKVTSSETESSIMTHTGKFIGSLSWASPEQAEGDPAKIDTRTDVYALGVILYQMLTGKLPHDVAGNLPGALQQILNKDPVPPSRLEKAINNEVETIVLRCLAKDRDRRYQTAGELARDVRRYLNGDPIEAKRDSAGYVLRKLMSRYRVSTAIAASFLIAGIVFGAVMAGFYRSARAEAETAGKQAAQALDEVERIKSQYQGLVASLDQHRVDLGRDAMPVILKKQDAMSKILDRFSSNALSLMVPGAQLGTDHVRFINAVSPRLTGRVVRVGPNQEMKSLQDVWSWLKPGDVVLLGAGRFRLPDQRRDRRRKTPIWTDVALIGSGKDQTVLTGRIEAAKRLRIENARLECANGPFTRLRQGGSILLRDCTLTGYNSGAGGSNAIGGNDVVLLADRCTFEGMPGRAVTRGSGGVAFDLRGPNFLYVRKSRFVDNSEITRATHLCIFGVSHGIRG